MTVHNCRKRPMIFLTSFNLLKRKGGDTDKMIIIQVETCNCIMGHAHSAFVSTRSIDDMEDALICDGWLHLDKEPGKLYSVQTKGGRNSDSTWCNHHENNAPLLQNLFCKRQTGRNPTNYCKSICGARIEIRLAKDTTMRSYLSVLRQDTDGYTG